MKPTRTTFVLFSVLAVLALLVSACGAKGPVTLTVQGNVKDQLDLTHADLQKMDVVTLTLEHPKKGALEYTGVRLADLLSNAGINEGAATLVMTASDGYVYEVDLAAVLACSDCLLAFDAENAGIYTTAMPGMESKAWVKNIITLEVK